MGRRNKNKGNGDDNFNDNAYLTKKKFRKRFCKQCGICGKNSSLRFCYTSLYMQNRIKFSRLVFPAIVQNREKLKQLAKAEEPPDFQDLQLIRRVFCNAELCEHCFGTSTKDLIPCFNAFTTQVRRSLRRESNKNVKLGVNLNKPEQKIKPKPGMFVMIPNNSSFESEVLRILEEYTAK